MIDYMNAMVDNFTTNLKQNYIISDPKTINCFVPGYSKRLSKYKAQ